MIKTVEAAHEPASPKRETPMKMGFELFPSRTISFTQYFVNIVYKKHNCIILKGVFSAPAFFLG